MSKSAISRASYFMRRRQRLDAMNENQYRKNQRPFSLRTMPRIPPPEPKKKVVEEKISEKVEIPLATIVLNPPPLTVEAIEANRTPQKPQKRVAKSAAKVPVKSSKKTPPPKKTTKVVAKAKKAPAKEE